MALRLFLFVSLLALTAPAFAADRTVTAEPLDAARMAVENAPNIPTSYDTAQLLCQSMLMLNSIKGPDYQPGIDAYGNPVVPAEGNQPAISAPKAIEIPITMDMAKHFGITTPNGTEMNTEVAKLSIMNDGKIMYNGQDISGKVNAFCNQAPAGKN